MRAFLLSALILASAFQTALGAVEGQWTYIVENGGATITASTATGVVTIPSVLGGYSVRRILYGNISSIFSSPSVVTVITIPNSVSIIESYAFLGCTSLTTITIPNSVTSIGSRAFAGCTSLTTITVTVSDGSDPTPKATIANSVTSIGSGAFADCTSLTTITIPNSVASIGSSAFAGCTRLGTVYLPTRFANTYLSFGLTASQVSFHEETTNDVYLRGQQSVINAPSSHNLYTATQYNAHFTAGENSILNSPNSNGLYTTSQIQNMAVGDLVLTKNADGSFTLNYDIEQSTDLQSWLPYQSFNQQITNLPPDKAFIRIKAKQ
jgi:hypothetical protein